MIPVIVIRPQPGCDATVAAARSSGLDALGFPLFEISPLPWDMPDPDDIDALLIGSVNALRHAGPALLALAGKPVYAVGEKTARAATEAGFDLVATGEGRLQAVLDKVSPCHRRLLRLAGAERVEVDPGEGIVITERTVYASSPLPMPAALSALLREPAIVLLHSAEAARHFASSCDTCEIDRSGIDLAAIAPRVADAAGAGWRTVRCAQMPNDEALLALARQMCDEAGEPQTARQGFMQDRTGIQGIASTPAAPRSGRKLLIVAGIAFALGAALAGWVAWSGIFDAWMPERGRNQDLAAPRLAAAGPAESPVADRDVTERGELEAVSSVETRLALLEDRLSRLNLQASAASGNAARAESLLIAFAARRMIDRGAPLGQMSDQLRLRFSNAQPRAVRTIIRFAQRPVTIDELSARLEALAPQLTGGLPDQNLWDTAMRELTDIFTVRSEPSALLKPDARIERARVMLRAGRIPEAIDQVRRLPGADAADTWIADANRYADAQQALDLIETVAMLEPSKLRDAEGNRVDQPSPLSAPAPSPNN